MSDPQTPATAAAWRELEMDALASDGPIRDSDVKDAIKRNRRRVESSVLHDISRQIRSLPTTFGPGIPINEAALLEREAVASFIDEMAG